MATAAERKKQRMSGLSVGFARGHFGEEPETRPVWTIGVMHFEHHSVGGPDHDVIKRVAFERLLEIPRFRSSVHKVSDDEMFFVEMDKSEVDLDLHVREWSEEMDYETILKRYVGDVSKVSINPRKDPLWQMLWFPNVLIGQERRGVLVMLDSHAIGDGISQVQVLFTLLDPVTDKEKAKTLQVKKRNAPVSTYGPLNKTRLFMKGVVGPFIDVFSTADPSDSPSTLRLKDLTKDSSPILSIAFTESLSLERVKEVKNKFKGATINDILVALLTMVITRYLEEDPETNAEVLSKNGTLRASYPVNMRLDPSENFKDGSPYNRAGMGFVRFPLEAKNRIEVVHTVKRTLDANKVNPGPFVNAAVFMGLSMLASKEKIGQYFVNMLTQATAMLSNVPGPQSSVTIFGNKIVDLGFMLHGRTNIYLGLMSYDGKVTCSINMDSGLGDAKEVAKYWKTEFDALYEECMQHEGYIARPVTFSSFLDRI